MGEIEKHQAARVERTCWPAREVRAVKQTTGGEEVVLVPAEAVHDGQVAAAEGRVHQLDLFAARFPTLSRSLPLNNLQERRHAWK